MRARQVGSRDNNSLGWRGWVWGGRYRLERYLYTAHRLAGLVLLLFLLVHLTAILTFRLQGVNAFAGVHLMFRDPLWRGLGVLAMAALSFHAANGLRLSLQELGYLLGRPSPPVFPYRDGLRRKRWITVTAMLLALVLGLAFISGFVAGTR
jgi:succinate dehydrogenase / fumarate reductase cytochrome b subunit